MIIALLAVAAIQPPPPPPPIVAIPVSKIPGEQSEFQPLTELSAAAQAKVRAQDAKAQAAATANGDARMQTVAAWRSALATNPLDLRALDTAAAAMDALNNGRGIFAGWARIHASLSPADRRILGPHLASSSGRIFINRSPTAPMPPQNPYAAQQRSQQEIASNRAFATLQQAVLDSGFDAELALAIAEKDRIEQSLPGIAHRQPFDAAALRKAYGDYARAIGRVNARRSEIVIEQLAKMPADQRALAIERIPYLATPLIATPPAPERK